MGEIDTRMLGKLINELLVLATLRGHALHGYQLALEAEVRSGGAVKLQHGTLYPILHRLERQGDVRSRWVEKGGRRRRLYELTHAGASRLRQETGDLRRTFDDVIEMLGPGREIGRGRGAAG